MECDRCGRRIEGGALVTATSRQPFRNLCRTCWGVETRSSNSRLISALNEMTRRVEDAPAQPRAARGRHAPAAEESGSERRRRVIERRDDPERPRWHP